MPSIGSCGIPSPVSLPEDIETLGAVHQGILVFSLISLEMLIGMSFHCTDHSKLEEETCDKMTTSYFVLITRCSSLLSFVNLTATGSLEKGFTSQDLNKPHMTEPELHTSVRPYSASRGSLRNTTSSMRSRLLISLLMLGKPEHLSLSRNT